MNDIDYYASVPGVNERNRMESNLERILKTQLAVVRLPAPQSEFRAIPDRRYRWDLAWPEHRLLVEIQGGTWMAKGGHNTGNGIERDTTKLNEAASRGWRCLQVTRKQIEDGRALMWIETCLKGES